MQLAGPFLLLMASAVGRTGIPVAKWSPFIDHME